MRGFLLDGLVSSCSVVHFSGLEPLTLIRVPLVASNLHHSLLGRITEHLMICDRNCF